MVHPSRRPPPAAKVIPTLVLLASSRDSIHSYSPFCPRSKEVLGECRVGTKSKGRRAGGSCVGRGKAGRMIVRAGRFNVGMQIRSQIQKRCSSRSVDVQRIQATSTTPDPALAQRLSPSLWPSHLPHPLLSVPPVPFPSPMPVLQGSICRPCSFPQRLWPWRLSPSSSRWTHRRGRMIELGEC